LTSLLSRLRAVTVLDGSGSGEERLSLRVTFYSLGTINIRLEHKLGLLDLMEQLKQKLFWLFRLDLVIALWVCWIPLLQSQPQ
jgi:hypothetical protein